MDLKCFVLGLENFEEREQSGILNDLTSIESLVSPRFKGTRSHNQDKRDIDKEETTNIHVASVQKGFTRGCLLVSEAENGKNVTENGPILKQAFLAEIGLRLSNFQTEKRPNEEQAERGPLFNEIIWAEQGTMRSGPVARGLTKGQAVTNLIENEEETLDCGSLEQGLIAQGEEQIWDEENEFTSEKENSNWEEDAQHMGFSNINEDYPPGFPEPKYLQQVQLRTPKEKPKQLCRSMRLSEKKNYAEAKKVKQEKLQINFQSRTEEIGAKLAIDIVEASGAKLTPQLKDLFTQPQGGQMMKAMGTHEEPNLVLPIGGIANINV